MIKPELSAFLVKPEQNLREVMQKIDDNGYGIALVVDENNVLLGLVTDGDIRRAIIKGTWLDAKIKEIMNSSCRVLDEKTEVKELFNLVIDSNIDCLPVVDAQRKVTDLLLGTEVRNVLTQRLIESTQKEPRNKLRHVLVTGGAGYVGSVLVRELLKKGYKVKVLDRLYYGNESLGGLEQQGNFKFIEADIGHAETLIEAVKDVDAVVHLAEIVGDPACAIDPQKTQQINHLSTLLLANVCKYLQVNRFVYASSCSVYGTNQDDGKLMETSRLNPVSLYAKMKEESEKAILHLADGAFSPTILRFATVFGESPRMRFDLVVNTLTAKAAKEGKITVFGGDQWRPFVHVRDVTKAIVSVIEAPLSTVRSEVFNVGSSENNLTIKNLARLIKETVPAAEVICEDKSTDRRDYRVDFSKIQRKLNFTAEVSLKEGISEILESMRQGKYGDYQHPRYSNQKTFENKRI